MEEANTKRAVSMECVFDSEHDWRHGVSCVYTQLTLFVTFHVIPLRGFDTSQLVSLCRAVSNSQMPLNLWLFSWLCQTAKRNAIGTLGVTIFFCIH